MKTIRFIFYIAGFLVLSLISCAPQVDVDAETAAVAAALNDYFEGAKTGDIERIAKAWADDPNIRITAPIAGASLVGWEQYRDHLNTYIDDESFKVNFITVRDQDIKISRSGDVAWFSENVDEEFVFQGQIVTFADMRWTGVLEKREGNWKIVQIHVSFARPGEAELEEVRAAIIEETRKHIEYVKQGDPVAIASQYAEDAIRWLPATGMTTSRKGVEEFWSAMLPADIDLSLTMEDLSVSGNMAIELGQCAFEMRAEGQEPMRGGGRYLVVWEHQGDGSWMVKIDILFPEATQ